MLPTSASSKRYLRIILSLADYPILGSRIRARMRTELYNRDIIKPHIFEAKVREMAIQSQKVEGLQNPFVEDSTDIWEQRISRIRDHLTDLVFSQHLSFEAFEQIVNGMLGERGIGNQDLTKSINLELAPLELLFEYATGIENLPPGERARYETRLQEARAILIRTLISEQLRYIEIAREWFTIADLAEIRKHKIGAGRIGGKAAGMLLAYRILMETLDEPYKSVIKIPVSYYVGSGELYTFMAFNNLEHWNSQKYKSGDQMRSEYPDIIKEFEAGTFPDDILQKLQHLVYSVGKKPLIVRSSSLLEDNFGTSFAGKYESIFLPNQGSFEENLRALIRTMGRIYASTLNPGALLYRSSKGLLDYDERMALLIQEVQGEETGHYYMPHAAGVAFSRNLYRWAPQIRREDGFVRLVWGMGTRAVDRVGNDYPRLIALSHPMLRPAADARSIRRYSQQYVDLIDLETNEFKTLPISEVLNKQYPHLRYLAQVEEDGYIASIRSNISGSDTKKLVLTFDEMLQRTTFADQMRRMLHVLEHNYRSPVDMEFTVALDQMDNGVPKPHITVLQCRPQSQLTATEAPPLPTDLDKALIIFQTQFMVPEGYIESINTIVFIPPEGYFALPSNNDRFKLGHTIGRLNTLLADEPYILIGPGRWGSSNSDLGVPIAYSDIYHARVIVEITGKGIGPAPEPSLGTHFFQDLLEGQIYPLAIYLDDPTAIFRHDFFYDTPNHLSEKMPDDNGLQDCLRLIHVSDFLPNHTLRLIMSDEKSTAMAFLTPKG
jgi:hypothetical protein